jgi:hypothetical protein
MKYVSKTHLIILFVLVLIMGAVMLAGERMSRQGFETRTTDNPSSAVGVNEKQLAYGDAQPQQMIQSNGFVIRPGQVKMEYTQALSLYGNSILQFNDDCQLSSKNRSFSLNNEVMIDNRSGKPNTFAVGDASVVLGPYDFGFMILRQKGTEVPVDCGIRRNVATLSVQ